MRDLATLIQAIAQLVGPFIVPGLIIAIVLIFKQDIQALLGRIKAGEMDAFGVHVKADLEQRVEQLQEVVATAESESNPITTTASMGLVGDLTTRLIPAPQPEDANETGGGSQQGNATEVDVIRQILELASSSPKVALIELSTTLERALRQLAASLGYDVRSPTLNRLTAVLLENDVLSKSIADSISQFSDVRNRIVHGRTAGDDEVISAIDSGLTIFKLIQAVPRATLIVNNPGITVYSDPECTQQRDDVLALILQSTSPGGLKSSHLIVPIPTTSTYSKGEQVSLEWEPNHIVPESWYRNPDTGEPAVAWGKRLMFAGRHLSDV